MHHDWLGGLYAWAGQYRTVELQKGNFTWPPAYRVTENMVAFERGTLAQLTPCRPGPLDRVAEAVAMTHADLLLIHPYRDCNGQLARWLADLMLAQAGFPVPDYGFVGRGSALRRETYLRAVTQGYLQNYAELVSCFVEAVRRRERDEALR